jgi:pyruvate formate lyase activating enzyme
MIIGGLQKFSLLDYPGHLAAIIFTQGCNFRCQFCYNPMLVQPINEANKLQNKKYQEENEEDYSLISEDSLLSFLKLRAGKLDSVVITGGEPTIQPDLENFVRRIKELEYKIKLDTNGTNPMLLKKLLDQGLVDYLAMDIKAAPQKYDLVTNIQPDLNNIKESIKILMRSKIPYEFRTTAVPELVTYDDISQIGKMIKGAPKWYLQMFKNDTDLINERFCKIKPYSAKEMEAMKTMGNKFVINCYIR